MDEASKAIYRAGGILEAAGHASMTADKFRNLGDKAIAAALDRLSSELRDMAYSTRNISRIK